MQSASDTDSPAPVSAMAFGGASSRAHDGEVEEPEPTIPALTVVSSGNEHSQQQQRQKASSSSPTSVDNVSNTSDTIEGIGKNFVDHIRRTEDENQLLKEKVEKLETEHKKLSDDNVRLLDRMKETAELNENVLAENQTLQQELDERTSQIHKQRDESDGLIKRLAEAGRARSAHQKLLDDKDSEVTRLKETIERLEGELERQSDERRRLAQQLKDRERDMRDRERQLGEELERARDGDEAARLERGELVTRLEECEGERDEAQSQLITVTTQLSQARADVDKEERKRRLVEKELSKLESEYDTLKDEMLDQKKEYFTLKNSEAFDSRELENQNNSLKITSQSLTKLLEEKDSHISDLREEVRSLQTAITGYQNEVEHVRALRADDDLQREKYREMADTHRKLLEENKRLRNSLALRNMEEASNATEHQDAKADLNKMAKRLEKANKRVVQLESYMDEIFGEDSDTLNQVLTKKEVESYRSGVSLPDIRGTPRSSVTTPRYATSRLSDGSAPAGHLSRMTNVTYNKKKRGQTQRHGFSYR